MSKYSPVDSEEEFEWKYFPESRVLSDSFVCFIPSSNQYSKHWWYFFLEINTDWAHVSCLTMYLLSCQVLITCIVDFYKPCLPSTFHHYWHLSLQLSSFKTPQFPVLTALTSEKSELSPAVPLCAYPTSEILPHRFTFQPVSPSLSTSIDMFAFILDYISTALMFSLSFFANFVHDVFIHTLVHHVLWTSFSQLHCQNKLLIHEDPVENHCLNRPYTFCSVFSLRASKA